MATTSQQPKGHFSALAFSLRENLPFGDISTHIGELLWKIRFYGGLMLVFASLILAVLYAFKAEIAYVQNVVFTAGLITLVIVVLKWILPKGLSYKLLSIIVSVLGAIAIWKLNYSNHLVTIILAFAIQRAWAMMFQVWDIVVWSREAWRNPPPMPWNFKLEEEPVQAIAPVKQASKAPVVRQPRSAFATMEEFNNQPPTVLQSPAVKPKIEVVAGVPTLASTHVASDPTPLVAQVATFTPAPQPLVEAEVAEPAQSPKLPPVKAVVVEPAKAVAPAAIKPPAPKLPVIVVTSAAPQAQPPALVPQAPKPVAQTVTPAKPAMPAPKPASAPAINTNPFAGKTDNEVLTAAQEDNTDALNELVDRCFRGLEKLDKPELKATITRRTELVWPVTLAHVARNFAEALGRNDLNSIQGIIGSEKTRKNFDKFNRDRLLVMMSGKDPAPWPQKS